MSSDCPEKLTFVLVYNRADTDRRSCRVAVCMLRSFFDLEKGLAKKRNPSSWWTHNLKSNKVFQACRFFFYFAKGETLAR